MMTSSGVYIRAIHRGKINSAALAQAMKLAPQKNGRATGFASTGGIFAADRLSDAHCGRGGNAQWNHIRKGYGVEGDLVTCQRHRAQARN